MQDQGRQINLLEDSLADYEGTIGQFRELVISLQGFVSIPLRSLIYAYRPS